MSPAPGLHATMDLSSLDTLLARGGSVLLSADGGAREVRLYPDGGEQRALLLARAGDLPEALELANDAYRDGVCVEFDAPSGAGYDAVDLVDRLVLEGHSVQATIRDGRVCLDIEPDIGVVYTATYPCAQLRAAYPLLGRRLQSYGFFDGR
ncbi:hypothetical protein COY28_04290 [Candidatus Woesearchaeota archaeon CG_4_10_14_0_2_um_filter_57_5]|nr:MAG: hypothetical protein AUJ68_02555 [Candidatus Woesearchaeota archaeon CG1_02_57_44]PIZ52746.1 MAG: hypothetical protein COY28_04290 [Candidatus Woesearchaeota archaeon CG_4_10_14_0_2_um_filter_57_5]